MEFRIADTFTSSLGRLSGDEQKAVKTTAFDLQMNPASPGHSFHKLDRARDKNFWSVRVNRDIRLIVHRSENSLLLCYVDHHDDAYAWAERRKLEIHPRTGAAQLVVVREMVQEIFIPVYVEQPEVVARAPKVLFETYSNDQLLSYGVPEEWLQDVRSATEDRLLSLVDLLPAEAAEALLELATGGIPTPVVPAKGIDPYTHPDAQRRFRTMHNVEELERAFDYPWDKWAVFLHPEQRQLVERSFSGPARVSGSAGTGKTIVALHRAVSLARRDENARVLLTTFSPILANALKVRLRKLISSEPHLAEQVDVFPIIEVGRRLYKTNIGAPDLIGRDKLKDLMQWASSQGAPHNYSLNFLLSEWEQVVDTWNLETWEAYRDVRRLGRKSRLPEAQRSFLWSVFARVNEEIKHHGKITESMMFHRLADYIHESGRFPYTHVVVDEAQDISVAQLRFLASFGKAEGNELFFAGDTGQRIFQQSFSWKSVGVDVRGRSKSLHVNYRTSHQIRQKADLLLGPESSDADGNIEERNKTISVFNGPKPEIEVLEDEESEVARVSSWIGGHLEKGVAPHEVGVFVRSAIQIPRAVAAVTLLNVPHIILDEKVETLSNVLAVSTMHLAKGLEFRYVVVMACDDEVVPSQERISAITDNADLEDVYNTERHLLYVACTRARDGLLVTAVDPASEFLEDLLVSAKNTQAS